MREHGLRELDLAAEFKAGRYFRTERVSMLTLIDCRYTLPRRPNYKWPPKITVTAFRLMTSNQMRTRPLTYLAQRATEQRHSNHHVLQVRPPLDATRPHPRTPRRAGR